VVVTTWEITVKLIFAFFIASAPLVANAWGTGGLPYMQGQQQTPPPQQSYSEQYNAGYDDAYQSAHGYPQNNGYGQAYNDGANAAWRVARQQ
jgi:hypothetical protein